MTLKTFLIIAASIWTTAMLIGFLTPLTKLPDVALSISDKAMHAGLFVGFTGLWTLAGQNIRRMVILGILYGLLIEVLQGILPVHRTADWVDALADTIGVFIGAGLTILFRRYVAYRL